MKIIKIISIIFCIVGALGIAVWFTDFISGSKTDPVFVHVVMLLIGWAGYYWSRKKISAKK